MKIEIRLRSTNSVFTNNLAVFNVITAITQPIKTNINIELQRIKILLIVHMESLRPDDVLKFLDLVNRLKHSSRRGWELCEVSNHEQIAGHMYTMGIMTFLLGNESKLDRFKCLQLALVHDLAECIVGDITPRDNITEDKKHQMEDDAMKELTGHVGSEIGSLIYNLYKEYEAKETPEAKFVKDLDRFDMIFTATHYETRDGTPKKLQEFFDATEGKFNHPYIKKLVESLEKRRKEQTLNQLEKK